MFYKESGVYRSTLLDGLPSLRHGFGTRQDEGWPGEYTRVRQIHSDEIVIAACDLPASVEGDALITAEPGHWIGVRTADCVPVLLADPEHRVVAAVHAGWRGTAAEILRKTIERLQSEFGTQAGRLIAAIGPAIGECCYEVGPEVAEQFTKFYADAAERTRLNLVEANRIQLTSSGVLDSNIDTADLCTMCGVPDFHSFRRDKEDSGRMVSAIRLEE
ncbi:MAG TPA: peptidoglycan editing factor PgeF [Bryobacteraceae bacterium]|nr:peptidoglycan editing factor PgeF [Bryobacteraceae bacterium]